MGICDSLSLEEFLEPEHLQKFCDEFIGTCGETVESAWREWSIQYGEWVPEPTLAPPYLIPYPGTDSHPYMDLTLGVGQCVLGPMVMDPRTCKKPTPRQRAMWLNMPSLPAFDSVEAGEDDFICDGEQAESSDEEAQFEANEWEVLDSVKYLLDINTDQVYRQWVEKKRAEKRVARKTATKKKQNVDVDLLADIDAIDERDARYKNRSTPLKERADKVAIGHEINPATVRVDVDGYVTLNKKRRYKSLKTTMAS